LNAAGKDIPEYFPIDFVYKSLPLNDFSSQILPIEESNMFLGKADEYHKVLIHCIEGKSRSVALALAYLMKREGWSLKYTYDLVKSRRPLIRPNDGFMKQLLEYENKLFGATTLVWEPRKSIFNECKYCHKYFGKATYQKHENACKDKIKA